DGTIGNSDMMPLWNQKLHKDFALHWDGLETSLTETTIAGAIGGNGATPKSVNIEGIQRVEDYILNFTPPKYPFEKDNALAERGSAIFDNNCASCHAFGGERTGTVIPIDEIGTDRHRLDMWTQEAVDAYKKFTKGYSWEFKELRKTDGYVAVALDGLWLRSPYLHNGSVPTLRDLLNKPEDRPAFFYRGIDEIDRDKVGFVSTVSEANSKKYFRFDTKLEGNSNSGHLYGTDLSSSEKDALVEFMKGL
ncbi:MAG: c-type cytochrome, partial [Oscillatoria sp. SIO1A7]|nr:c-type cytochrome [Oscillatoria sp. SIO1A7]